MSSALEELEQKERLKMDDQMRGLGFISNGDGSYTNINYINNNPRHQDPDPEVTLKGVLRVGLAVLACGSTMYVIFRWLYWINS